MGIIIVPTQEPAIQVQKEVQSLVPLDMDIRCMAVHGGISKEDQVSRLCGTVDGATIHVVRVTQLRASPRMPKSVRRNGTRNLRRREEHR